MATTLSLGVFATQTAADVAGVGTEIWGTPSNARVRDGSTTVVALAVGTPTSHWLQATDFGFNIPSDATILGIEFIIRHQASLVNSVVDSAVRPVKAGVIQGVGTDHSSATNWPNALTDRTYGGSVDMWSTTWTPSDINASGFGFAISATWVANAPTARIDVVECRIHFSVPGERAVAIATVAADTAGIGTVAWGNGGNGAALDNTLASATLADAEASKWLVVDAFGFAIPARAQILGIQVDVSRCRLLGLGPVSDNAIRLVKAGVIQATDRATATAWPTSTLIQTFEAHGSLTDEWGDIWAPSDINHVDFGAAISAKNALGGAGLDIGAIDGVVIWISYTTAASAGGDFLLMKVE